MQTQTPGAFRIERPIVNEETFFQSALRKVERQTIDPGVRLLHAQEARAEEDREVLPQPECLNAVVSGTPPRSQKIAVILGKGRLSKLVRRPRIVAALYERRPAVIDRRYRPCGHAFIQVAQSNRALLPQPLGIEMRAVEIEAGLERLVRALGSGCRGLGQQRCHLLLAQGLESARGFEALIEALQ